MIDLQTSSHEQEIIDKLVARLTDVVLASSGPLSVSEISALSEVGEDTLRNIAGDDVDIYTWLIGILARAWFAKCDAIACQQPTMNALIAYLGGAGREDFQKGFHFTHMYKNATVGVNGGVQSAEGMDAAMGAFRTMLNLCDKVRGEEELSGFVRLIAQQQIQTNLPFYAALCERRPEVTFTMEELLEYVAKGHLNVRTEMILPLYLKHVAAEQNEYGRKDLTALFSEVASLMSLDTNDVAQREYCKILCFIIIGQATHGKKMREALDESDTALDAARAMVALFESVPKF